MRDKDLEQKRNDFIKAYYRLRKKQDSQLTKSHIILELNSFFVFTSASNIYKILQEDKTQITIIRSKKNNLSKK